MNDEVHFLKTTENKPVTFLASEQDFDPLSIIRCESQEFEARLLRIFLI